MTYLRRHLIVAGLALALPCSAQYTPRAATRVMPAGDPNLSADWAWYAQQGLVDLYYSPAGGTPSLASVYLPWYSDGNIMKSYEPDIYPEDGWMLAYRDFGTPTVAPQFPYFVLYNKYRAKFRLMVYKPYQQNNTYYMADLSFLQDPTGVQNTALMTFTADDKCFINDFNKEQIESCTSLMGVYGSWGVFDFDLAGYDPALDTAGLDPVIQISIKGVNTSSIKLKSDGSVTLDQILGNNASLSSSRPNALASLATSIGTATKYYKAVDGFKTDLTKAVTDKKADGTYVNQDQPWFGAAQALAPLVSSLGPWGAVAGAGIGLISGLLGGGSKSAPMEPLRFKGVLSLDTTGTITDSQAVLSPIDLCLKSGPQSLMGQRPVQAIPWGIFNLRSKPAVNEEVHLQELGEWRSVRIYQNGRWISQLQWFKTGEEYSYSLLSGTAPEVVVNPSLGMQLVSTTARFGTKNYNDNNSWATFPSSSYFSSTMSPNLFGLEFTFQISNPKYSDSTIKIFKAFPLSIATTTYVVEHGPVE